MTLKNNKVIKKCFQLLAFEIIQFLNLLKTNKTITKKL
jgi:hypothetical protein